MIQPVPVRARARALHVALIMDEESGLCASVRVSNPLTTC